MSRMRRFGEFQTKLLTLQVQHFILMGELPSIMNSKVVVANVMADWLMLTVTFKLVTVFFVIFNRLRKFLVHLKQYGRLVLCLNLDEG